MDSMECIKAINNNNCDKRSQDCQWHEKRKDPNLHADIDNFWFANGSLWNHRAATLRSLHL